MKNLEKTVIDEIITLHDDIFKQFKLSLEKAIRIGELLIEQKKGLPHGEFIKWINDKLPFTDRTARNYMKSYSNRDKIKTETISDLTKAYKLLTEPKSLKEAIDNIENKVYKDCFDNIYKSRITIELGKWRKGKIIAEFIKTNSKTGWSQISMELKKLYRLYQKYTNYDKYLKIAEKKAKKETLRLFMKCISDE